jgi:hypothetical protein
MNAYTLRGQARSQPGGCSAVRPAHRVMGGGSRAGLEWQRDCQAEVEVERLLKHNGVTPQVHTSFVSVLRQTMGTALVRAGVRLAGVPHGGDAPEPAPVAGTVGIAV